MLKRIAAVFILGACVFGLRGSAVEAHLAGYTYTPTFRHVSSYDCLGHFYQIPNPTQHPAAFQCVAVAKEIQVTCVNPQGKRVTPGKPSGPYTLVGQIAFNENDRIEEKIKGRATKKITFADEGSPLFQACSERNRNWITVDEIVRLVEVSLRTFNCVDANCATLGQQAYEAKLNCTVPAGYSLPDNPLVGEVDYHCDLIGEAHCDKGDVCPIP